MGNIESGNKIYGSTTDYDVDWFEAKDVTQPRNSI